MGRLGRQALISPARLIAFDVLRRVHGGGYASDLLLLKSAELGKRDAGLAEEIVMGCLRYQAQLDYLIAKLARVEKLDPEVRITLRMGIYQLRYLSRIPPHAAVQESVELVKRARKRSATGFVNAVLRKVNRKPETWPDRATRLSCPEWLLESWERQFGVETAEGIAGSFLKPPTRAIASTGRVQDPGSQAIVPLLGIQSGQTMLDLCAAPGNKTAQAIEAGARVIACDVHRSRLNTLQDLSCARVVLDAAQPLPFDAKFDRILVDAPCSGTGTLARNPEIRWRLAAADLEALQAKQKAILGNAIACLKTGGMLVYATCSLEAAENEDVIAAFPLPWKIWRRIPGHDQGDGFFAAVLNFGE
ncbi:MAG TPA: transcription antitermination factor NusB [Bryobacteraceae bacterium]|nr:transcription antitermination factor NusB [Bryobacteraceae bacterium]